MQRCQKCRKEVKSFHAKHTDGGLCKFCNQKYTYLPDGEIVTWVEYKAYWHVRKFTNPKAGHNS